MDVYVLTRCISKNSKCIAACDIFLDEQSAENAIDKWVKDSIRECVEKYEVNPNNIEPKKDQGATLVQMYDGLYVWKIRKAESVLEPGDVIYILLHAHNRGYVSYAESHSFANMEDAVSAMKSSHKSALTMWQLMVGKSQFENVEATIENDSAKVQLGGEVEIWRIEKRILPKSIESDN